MAQVLAANAVLHAGVVEPSSPTQSINVSISAKVDVFAQTAGPLISEFVVDGSNCSVFTFGQTGSGKTFTMVDQQQMNDVDFNVQASYMEVYNEQVFDLMS